MKKTIKRTISLLLLAAMVLTLIPFAAAAELKFTDVPESAWYYEDVRLAVDTGLVSGKGNNRYAPDDNVTYAETVKLAAVMWMLVNTGSTEFEKSSPWYQTYVDYAKTNKIIAKDYTWNDAATRANFMDIFSRALPDKPVLTGAKELESINEIADGAIPDVPMTHPQADAIYKLYRAGIVTGSDKEHNCKPNTNIRRSEVAAILTRMMHADKRQSFALGETAEPNPAETKPEEKAESLKFTQQPQSASAPKDGSASFTVAVAGGKAPYSYQWQSQSSKHGWNDLTNDSRGTTVGANTPTLTISKSLDVAASLNYQFRCVITDAEGKTVTSNTAKILLTLDPLTITAQPEGVIHAFFGFSVTFTVTVSGGDGKYTYDWQVRHDGGVDEWTSLPAAYLSDYYKNADQPTLTIKVSSTDQYDNAQYRCVITDGMGSTVTSNAVSVHNVIEGTPDRTTPRR